MNKKYILAMSLIGATVVSGISASELQSLMKLNNQRGRQIEQLQTHYNELREQLENVQPNPYQRFNTLLSQQPRQSARQCQPTQSRASQRRAKRNRDTSETGTLNRLIVLKDGQIRNLHQRIAHMKRQLGQNSSPFPLGSIDEAPCRVKSRKRRAARPNHLTPQVTFQPFQNEVLVTFPQPEPSSTSTLDTFGRPQQQASRLSRALSAALSLFGLN